MFTETNPPDDFRDFWTRSPEQAPPRPTTPSTPELIALYTRHMEQRNLAPGTIDKRGICLRAFARSLDGRSLLDASGDDVEAFLAGRKIGPRARYTLTSHLHCFYRWATEAGLTTENPAEVDRPHLPRLIPRPAKSEQLAEALTLADPLPRAWIVLAAYQGLEVAEIAGLRREDVLDGDKLLRVVGRRGAERILPLHPVVLEALEALPMPRAGWLFERPQGGRYSAERMSAVLNGALRDLGCEATARQLRHWFGVQLYAASGRDLLRTQQLMGHAQPTTTAAYSLPPRPALP